MKLRTDLPYIRIMRALCVILQHVVPVITTTAHCFLSSDCVNSANRSTKSDTKSNSARTSTGYEPYALAGGGGGATNVTKKLQSNLY
jgi:hypothetical protein